MQKQILRWKAEHVDFLQLLDLLELQIGPFHEGATPNYDLMLDIVYYLTHFADKFHHPREDVQGHRMNRCLRTRVCEGRCKQGESGVYSGLSRRPEDGGSRAAECGGCFRGSEGSA